MKINSKLTQTLPVRAGERGAALIMMLLVAMLLLAAGGALIVSTAMSTTTVYESAPEAQAYYAAEAGLEEALAVLRGNVRPQDATSPVNGTPLQTEKISFRRAVDHAASDLASDPAAAPELRFSRWLAYNYTPPGGAYADRVTLQAGYPLTGTAYNITLRDPDDSTSVGFTTTGMFKPVPGASVSNGGRTITFNNAAGAGAGTGTISYTPRTTSATFTAYPTPATGTDMGSFQVTATGLGAPVPAGATFQLTINQSAPWQASNNYTARVVGDVSSAASTVQLQFLRDIVAVDGTRMLLSNLTSKNLSVSPLGTAITLQGTITAPEPKRVLVRSNGFGPRGARKQLEMLVTRTNLDFEAPATLTLRGADDCSAASLTFGSGSSNSKEYKGVDASTPPESPRPAFATTACGYDEVVSGTSKPEAVIGSAQVGILDNGTAAGSLSSEPVDTPGFLQTANKTRQYVDELEGVARSQGRYFKPASGSSTTVNSGTSANPVLTFVDGNCELEGGAGMLIVTGTLTMSGNPSFDGVILVLGGGVVTRNGGGSGTVNGAMVVARFARTWPAADDDPAIDNNIEYPFLAPTFNTDGGGNSTMQYSSSAVTNALNMLGVPRVAGFAER